MREGIIKVTMQFPDGLPIEPKCVNSKWRNEWGVLVREKYKITWVDWGAFLVNEKEALWELIKAHYVFPSEHEEHGKRATILAIGRALWRFRHLLNKFYVQPEVSPLKWFGFITPIKWNTFQQLHSTLEVMVRSNRMKELIQKNKFKHRLGPGAYKATIPLWTKKEQETGSGVPFWTKKEQEIREVGIPVPLEGCTFHTWNWIRGRSRIYDIGQLVTSNSDIIRVIKNAKDLITKEKTGECKP
jgi:hypothetical protein